MAAVSLFSDSWYRVAGLRPRLKTHITVHRHDYRGQEWFVLEDLSNASYLRFSPEAYAVIGRLDGAHTMDQVWQGACAQLGDDMPTQDETIRLLAYLHQRNLIQSDLPPDVKELHRRHVEIERKARARYLASPLFWKLSLFDPDRFLEWLMPLARPLMSRAGLILWMLVVGLGSVITVLHWSELTENLTDRILTLESLFFVGLLYPLLKALHELGHALAVKERGGEVHQMGVMLMLFMPIPYVDASASLGFANKWDRIRVAAAGILVETFLASIAALVWLLAEPGVVRAVAFNVMLIGLFSTLLFNANPLLKFDGYHILSDWLEIPNMGIRAKKYGAYLFQRYMMGIAEVENPGHQAMESFWLFLYWIGSFAYRTLIIVNILLVISQKANVLGLFLTAWVIYGVFVGPVIAMTRRYFWLTYMHPRKLRATIPLALTASVLIFLLWGVKLPSYTLALGVLSAPEASRVRARTAGFIRELLAKPGETVKAGQPLIRCEEPGLPVNVAKLEAQVAELAARERLLGVHDKVQAEILKDELKRVRAELEDAKQRQDELIVTAPKDGIFVLSNAQDLEGRHVTRGEPVGFAVTFEEVNVRAVVTQDDIDRVRHDVLGVEVRLANEPGRVFPAKIIHELPAASKDLPSLALSTEGGGNIALDPNAQDIPRSFKTLFQFDLELEGARVATLGTRAHVRFEHSPETLASRLYRRMRRVFLRQFGT